MKQLPTLIARWGAIAGVSVGWISEKSTFEVKKESIVNHTVYHDMLILLVDCQRLVVYDCELGRSEIGLEYKTCAIIVKIY
jgi:hypothetical protein